MTETVAAVVVAAGRGERAGGSVPKQYRPIAGEPMIRAALHAFVGHPRIDFVQPVINPSDRDSYDCAIAGLKDLLPPVAGGATRQASVLAGLEALASRSPGLVLIHDAARPFVSAALIDRRQWRRSDLRRGGSGYRACGYREIHRPQRRSDRDA